MYDHEKIAKRLLKGIILHAASEKLCFLVEGLARRQPSKYKDKTFPEIYNSLRSKTLQVLPYYKHEILLRFVNWDYLHGRFAAEFKCPQDRKMFRSFFWRYSKELEDYLSDDVNGLVLKLNPLAGFIQKFGESIRNTPWGKYMAADAYWKLKGKEKRLEKEVDLEKDEGNIWGFSAKDLQEKLEKEMQEFQEIEGFSFFTLDSPYDNDSNEISSDSSD